MAVVAGSLREQNAKAREREIERTRAKILKTAYRLYAAGGYAAVSMRDLAKRLGCSAQALYHYYASKTALFEALADEGFRLLELQHPAEELPDPLDNLRLPFERYYEFSKAQPSYFMLLWVDPVAAVSTGDLRTQILRRMVVDVRRRVQRCVDEGIFPADLDTFFAHDLLIAAVHGPALARLTGRPQLRCVDELATKLLDAAIRALKAGAANKTPADSSTGPSDSPP
jgi:AcrR family transcriptional regulator